MFAAVSKDAVRAKWIEAFKELAVNGRIRSDMTSPGHHDGWGIAAYIRQDFPEYLERQSHSVTMDTEVFKRAAAAIQHSKAPAAMAHFRKVTSGDHKISNTQPFLRSSWSFCHNGTIENPEQIPLKSLTPSGSTDSERLFLFLLENLDPENVYESLQAAILRAKRGLIYSSITFLLSNGKVIFAYRDCDMRFSDYYTLYTAQADNGRIVCSEPLPSVASKWDPVPNKTLLAINC